MTQQRMLELVRQQLAIDMNCAPADFLRGGFTFCEAEDRPGRRPFPRDAMHFDMLTMGEGVVVTASADLLPRVRAQLQELNRDDAFSQPFIRGQGLYFLPDLRQFDAPRANSPQPPWPADLQYELLRQDEIAKLFSLTEFGYAINGPDHPRPDVLATVARQGDAVVAVAGASADCEMLWQIGINVLPAFRHLGLATLLVQRLTAEILRCGKVPYYGTASSNVASQRVAHRAGFQAAWTCVYRACFDDMLTMPSGD